MVPLRVQPRPLLPPSLLVLLSIFSTQLGSALAKPLFSELPPPALVLLRVGFAALMLASWQGLRWYCQGSWRSRPAGATHASHPDDSHDSGWTGADIRLLIGFGLSIALMNGFFYAAIARIPIGIAVTLEFLGPLGVAALNSRRKVDLLWLLLAGAGVVLLTPTPDSPLDPMGIFCALVAAVGWGLYILLSARAGRAFEGIGALAVALSVATLALVPTGVAAGGLALFQPRIMAIAAGVAFLSSVMTYTLELAALKRMAVNTFGVLMSLEPAIAAGLGFALLGEALSWRAGIAIALVSFAAAGSALGQAKAD